MKKVSVYIPAHNYGAYIERAVQSIFDQTMSDWELIIINDGSTDNTSEILKKYEGHPQIKILEQQKKGLSVSNNIALRLSNAQYLMRLDADDFLDENALLVMSNILDTKKEIGLVYPDYYLVDNSGEILELVRRKKIGSEVGLLDLPAHGACTMIRKQCLMELGGYEETIKCQDGYDLWLRFLQSFKPYNVNIPLFYYRQHEGSLTKNERLILDTQRSIKRNFVKNRQNNKIPKVLGVIPVLKRPIHFPDSAFVDINGKPLIEHTLVQTLQTNMLDRIVVTSNDEKILRFAKKFKNIETLLRPEKLASTDSRITHTVKHVLKTKRYSPDAVMLLYVNTPFRRAAHIEMAIDTLSVFKTDSIVSVTEELAYCYHHGKDGLHPIQKDRLLRLEKKGIYKETGAVMLTKTKSIDDRYFIGGRTGHIMMLPEESIRIKTHFDLWLARKIASEWLPNQTIAPNASRTPVEAVTA